MVWKSIYGIKSRLKKQFIDPKKLQGEEAPQRFSRNVGNFSLSKPLIFYLKRVLSTWLKAILTKKGNDKMKKRKAVKSRDRGVVFCKPVHDCRRSSSTSWDCFTKAQDFFCFGTERWSLDTTLNSLQSFIEIRGDNMKRDFEQLSGIL